MNTQTLEPSSQEQLMFTQPKDQNNKNKPAYKKYCSYCHRRNHSISACFKKQRDDEVKREAYARSKSPQKSFVQYFRSPSNDRTKHSDNRYRSRSTSKDNSYNKNYSQNRYRSTSRERFSYDKSTTPTHYSRSRYDTYKRDSLSYRSPYRSSYRSPLRHNSRPRYRSRSYSRDNKFKKHTNSYRPPSRPRDFEVSMYHPTAMANAVTPTSWFYTLYVHTPSSIVQRDNPSRLEIAFLLDSGASFPVLNYPTYITLTKLLDVRPNHTSDVGPTRNSKTLTVANQTEVPILHYANIILNTTIDENSRYFSVPFAVADIKYNILGTPFFEDNIQNINIQSTPVNSYPDNSDLRLIRTHLRSLFRDDQSNIIRLIRISHYSYHFIPSLAIRISRIPLYKTLHSNSNINQKHTQIMQSSQHFYLKIILISLLFIELIPRLKYA